MASAPCGPSCATAATRGAADAQPEGGRRRAPARGRAEQPEEGLAATRPDGSLSVSGYSRSWQASDYLFYTETVRVTVRNGAGQSLVVKEATCTRDLGTTATIDCDQAAHTITARTAGAGFIRNDPVRIAYFVSATSQATADSPRFSSFSLGTPDIVHTQIPVAGAWSDTGFAINITTDFFYYAESIQVRVTTGTGLLVGQGSASCVLIDHGAG
jgi:hypothetical protein